MIADAPLAETFAIGEVRLASPVLLAPMTGVSDVPFRRLVMRFGCGLVFSEMIASRELLRQTAQSLRMARFDEVPGVRAVQLAGCDPEIMADAARFNEDLGAQLVDINFGCPVKKVVGGQAGSALMRDEALAGRILEAVARATDLPVTLKMRLGWDEQSLNAPAIARIAADAGIRMITVHGRTRAQFYDGSADWRAVRAVREATDLPLVVNGDITDLASARRALKLSGAGAVMVGRGAYGRPWLPAQLGVALRTGAMPPPPPATARLEIIREHHADMLGFYGRHQGTRIFRKHLRWYLEGLGIPVADRAAVLREDDPDRVAAVLGGLAPAAFDNAA